MPCHDSEEDMNAPDEDPLRTPTKRTGNGGAVRVQSNGEGDTDSEDSEEEQGGKVKRTWNGRAEYTKMKRWVTGERLGAEMESEDIDRELFELARDYMSASKLKKLPGHIAKSTDHALWKQYRHYTNRHRVYIRLFRCPLRHSTGSNAGIRIMVGPGFKQLDRCCEHDANSHDEDKSKHLKCDQIIAVTDAVTVAPTLSAAQLRRNMQLADPDSPGKKIGLDLLRSMENIVRS